ncbi:MAG: hypothetical protein HY231_12340 [Acidobacteria bacterium]|nr:hypothetical protein [Acidobacteriota bacterium]
MALYTFIMEYAGGTYISQVRSQSPESAIKKWLKNLVNDSPLELSAKIKIELEQELSDEVPTPIEGISKTWCISSSVQKKMVLVNVVQTHEEK